MADKLTLPKAKTGIELVAGGTDAAMKAAEATTSKLFRVPVDKIKVIPGFNLRVETPDYIEHRDALRASIAANGYNPKKPISGYVGKDGDESVIYVTDGHTRLSAVQEHNADPDTAEKDEITSIPVLVAPKETVLSDLLVELHTANNGRELTPFEKGILAKRLLGEGLDKKDISVKLGFTPRYLDDVLLLANADGGVKQHVASGAVSSTAAIGFLRKDADTAADKIAEIVKKAAATGKKATKKLAGPKMVKSKLSHSFDAGDDMKEIVKSIASLVRTTVAAEEGEDDVKLAINGGVIELVISLPAPPKAEKAEKAAKPKAEKKAPAKKAAAAKKAPAKKADADDADEAKPAKKAPAKKAAAEKAPAKKPKADVPVEGMEPVEDDDSEEAILPPKVASDPDVEEVDI